VIASKPHYLESVREEIACGSISPDWVRDLAGAALRRAQEAHEQGFEAEAMELARFYVDALQSLGGVK